LSAGARLPGPIRVATALTVTAADPSAKVISTMFKRTVQALSFLILVALSCSAVAQQNYYIDISNQTGYTIMYAYVSPADAQSWEEDVLGADVLRTGTSVRITLNGYFSPIFDIRLVDEDGDTYTFWKVDVSKHDLVVTLADLD
jgi:hypothetical protein